MLALQKVQASSGESGWGRILPSIVIYERGNSGEAVEMRIPKQDKHAPVRDIIFLCHEAVY